MKIGTHILEPADPKVWGTYKYALENAQYYVCSNCGLVVYSTSRSSDTFFVSGISGTKFMDNPNLKEISCNDEIIRGIIE